MTRLLPYVWYPAVLTGAVAGFAALLRYGAPAAVAGIPPLTVVAGAIFVLEQRFPERCDWRPRAADIRADAAFLVLVQLAWPRMLATATAPALASWTHPHAPSRWWPQRWPLAAQIVAMVLLVDLLRYWLHRACHRFDLLWRLHEVHHSPDILYVLNVARFHPVEKALHFAVDTVPFVMLGVKPEVMAGYFLLYSANGLFQHSNLNLRYGWLNRLVGSAETHRWHHARDPRTAACNFGNTTLVWDVLFGTWRLPDGRAPDEVGIPDRTYPKSFSAQMTRPFRRRALKAVAPSLATTLVELRLRWTRVTRGIGLHIALRDPMRAQRKLLARILRKNRNTSFGRAHRFDAIGDAASFAAAVPVRDFEQLRPFIDAEIERGEAALTAERPPRYLRTSGTTGRPKDVPLTASHHKALRRDHETALAFQHRTFAEAFKGSIVALVSPAEEGRLGNGKPFGSASGIVACSTPAPVRKKFVVPPDVLRISDSRVKYLLILRLALARNDVTYFGAANPTTFLALIRLYREHQDALIEDLRNGTFFLGNQVPADVLEAVGPRLAVDPRRADALSRLRLTGRCARLEDLFPELRLVVTWTCASAGVAVGALRRELSPRTRILELGYVASEFRGTMTLGRRAGSGLPTLHTHFFEFVERKKWDDGTPEFLTLDRILKGVDYYVIVTTPSGLYRYFINDLVRVTGFLHRAPLLQFRQKGKGVTNITGEKLYEAQVLAAVLGAVEAMGRATRFAMMLADERARRYRLYVETDPGMRRDRSALAEAVDARLAALNIEYRCKRESERLGPIDARWLAAGTGDAYKQHCVSSGQREGQFKASALAYARDFRFDLDAHVEE